MEETRPFQPADWPAAVHRTIVDEGVRLVAYVPDAGLKRLIQLVHDDASLMPVPLTTEEEGVGLAMGAWLGGKKCIVLLQSSGVGNLVNALGAIREGGFPFFMLVSMRGEEGEFNPWQVPMGGAAPSVLREMGVDVRRVGEAAQAAPAVSAALGDAFGMDRAVGVLLSQSLIGIKSFQEQREW
jgi:sulfopyruvate decarboxylase alpha subunit